MIGLFVLLRAFGWGALPADSSSAGGEADVRRRAVRWLVLGRFCAGLTSKVSRERLTPLEIEGSAANGKSGTFSFLGRPRLLMSKDEGCMSRLLC